MQLDAFLRSVELHVPELFEELVVLYRATGAEFAEGYEHLRGERPGIRWSAESSFRDDLLLLCGGEQYLVFHTDDDVYFRSVGPFELRDDEVCFTLRLGLNTTYCYPLDVVEELRAADVSGDRISWAWDVQDPGAYSYPLALNAHIFRAADAHDWLVHAEYSNPNELEAALQAFASDVQPRMASLPHSAVVSIPANLVNETHPNRHGALHDVSELNRRFLAGERIDLASMTFNGINACHVEIPYAFRHDRPLS